MSEVTALLQAGSEPSGEDEEDWEDKKIETPRGSAEKENHVVSTRKVYVPCSTQAIGQSEHAVAFFFHE